MPTAPCDSWTTVDEVRCCPGKLATFDDDVVQDAIDAAGQWLWAKSGRQFGVCSTVVRPTADQFVACDTDWWLNRMAGLGYISSTGYLFWSGVGSCGCHGDNYVQSSSCGGTPAVSLGYAPITAITSVTIDGVVLGAGNYTVVDGEYLLRTDGQWWPCCQNRALASGVGTWSVALSWGQAVPMLGNLATRALARFLLSLCDDGACAVPANAVSASRQGMVVELADPAELFSGERTGLPPVDLFIGAYNPNGLQQPSVAVIPGMTPYSTLA